MADRRHAEPGYETSDVRPARVVLVGSALGAGAGLIALLLLGVVRLLEIEVTKPAPGPLALIDRVPPEPRLQAEPALDLEELQAREALILESYGWVDREAGVARIPLSRAVALLVERGWPNPVEGRSAAAAPPADRREGASR
jgi:hypothetical protein